MLELIFSGQPMDPKNLMTTAPKKSSHDNIKYD